MWLDLPPDQVRQDLRFTSATPHEQDAIEHYHREGWWRVDSLFSPDELDRVFARYQAARDGGRILEGTMLRRHLNPQRYVPEINELFADQRLAHWVDLFMGRASVPFQTIVGEWGTAQEIHTDAIHQTTFPLGFHVSAWLACEDIAVDAGPLFYYPRSHRLPYVLATDCGISDAQGDTGVQYRHKYVPHIEAVVAQHALHRELFIARKGDVLIWHHNLLHGGSEILNPALTRRAMALFFYGSGALHYHDLSGDRAASDS
jgi:ectoine hydroxylase-related dioxygenase (phytanoyl-CoA dioxygenase family)